MSQESADDLPEAFAPGLKRMQLSCQVGLWSHRRHGGLLQAHLVVGKIHFLAAVELMVACFFKASRTESDFSSLISRPYFKGPT